MWPRTISALVRLSIFKAIMPGRIKGLWGQIKNEIVRPQAGGGGSKIQALICKKTTAHDIQLLPRSVIRRDLISHLFYASYVCTPCMYPMNEVYEFHFHRVRVSLKNFFKYMYSPPVSVYELAVHGVEQNSFRFHFSNTFKIKALHRSLYSRFARLASWPPPAPASRLVVAAGGQEDAHDAD